MPETILVVDDDDATRKLISTILRQDGYEVLDAPDFETATEVHRRNRGRIDLLLTDVSLGGPSGCELAAVIRRSEPDLPVLFISGLPWMAEFESAGLTPDGVEFLQKPFGITDLLGSVQHLSLRTAQ